MKNSYYLYLIAQEYLDLIQVINTEIYKEQQTRLQILIKSITSEQLNEQNIVCKLVSDFVNNIDKTNQFQEYLYNRRFKLFYKKSGITIIPNINMKKIFKSINNDVKLQNVVWVKLQIIYVLHKYLYDTHSDFSRKVEKGLLDDYKIKIPLNPPPKSNQNQKKNDSENILDELIGDISKGINNKDGNLVESVMKMASQCQNKMKDKNIDPQKMFGSLIDSLNNKNGLNVKKPIINKDNKVDLEDTLQSLVKEANKKGINFDLKKNKKNEIDPIATVNTLIDNNSIDNNTKSQLKFLTNSIRKLCTNDGNEKKEDTDDPLGYNDGGVNFGNMFQEILTGKSTKPELKEKYTLTEKQINEMNTFYKTLNKQKK